MGKELKRKVTKTIKYKNMANTPFKMAGPSLYSPLNKKGWIRKIFSKKKKQKTEETSTESLNRQVKEKDDYYSRQTGTKIR